MRSPSHRFWQSTPQFRWSITRDWVLIQTTMSPQGRCSCLGEWLHSKSEGGARKHWPSPRNVRSLLAPPVLVAPKASSSIEHLSKGQPPARRRVSSGSRLDWKTPRISSRTWRRHSREPGRHSRERCPLNRVHGTATALVRLSAADRPSTGAPYGRSDLSSVSCHQAALVINHVV